MADDTEAVKAALQTRRPSLVVPDADLLSSGSTMLNLGCSGRIDGATFKGGYFYLVGDSSSGKTWLTMAFFAEANINRNFDKHRFVYDNAENGALMDLEAFFGERMAGRMRPPNGTWDDPRNSVTIEEFYYNLTALQKANKPFIYALDSMDALTSKDDEAHHDKEARAFARTLKDLDEEAADTAPAEEKVKGSYGVSRAKKNSGRMRVVVNRLRDTGSVLIVLGQTRDNIGFGSQYQPKTRSGGTSLTFYAHHEVWLSRGGTLRRYVKGKDRKVGIVSRADVEKSRLTGREVQVSTHIRYSVGVDDVSSMIAYLTDEGVWKLKGDKGAKTVTAPEFDFHGKLEDLADHITEEGEERTLQALVSKRWKEVEEAMRVTRRNRYV